MSGHSTEYLNKSRLVPHFITTDGDGKEINRGDLVTGHRGNVAQFIRATRASQPGKSGKVVVHWIVDAYQGEYYSDVFNLHVKEV